MRTRHRLVAAALTALIAAPAAAVDPAFEVCVSEFPTTPLTRVIYATNTGSVPLNGIFAEGYASAADMVAGQTWDFTPATGTDRVLQVAPVDAAWSCSVSGQCSGQFGRSTLLLVQDDLTTGSRDVNAIQFDGASTFFLRAQVSDENASNEIRACFEGDVEFLAFPRPGGCLGEGDAPWRSSLNDDQAVTQDSPCSNGGPDACISGFIGGRAARNGTLTLPSGHVVDSTLVEIQINFDDVVGILFGGCVVPVSDVLQQYLMTWLVPHYGPLVQLSSPSGVTDLSWTSAGSTTIGYGLLPPVSAQVDSVTDTEVTISWDPGALFGLGADSFVVHWGTQPGLPTTSTDDLMLTIPATQLSHTVSGLQPGTDYCFSVSSRSTYTDPVASIPVIYDSIALPVSIGADTDGDGNRDTSYPPEVCVRTTGGSADDLLRDDSITPPMPPINPPLSTLLPLTVVYQPGHTSGDPDLDSTVIDDAMRPLVLYQWSSNRTIRLTKSGTHILVY